MRHPSLATREHSGLLLVDLQEPFVRAVADGEMVLNTARLLLQAAALMEVPVLASTQYTERLGPVVPEIAALLGQGPIDKLAFSCCGSPVFLEALNRTHRRIWVICGVESHICVCQTALDLLQRGHRVHAVADGVSSRTPQNRDVGLRKMEGAGVVITSAETVVYEWLGEAGTTEFGEILKLIR